MIKKILCLTVALFTSISAFAASGFVTSKLCPVLSEATFSSARLGVLKNGDKVECLEEAGRWIKIRKDNIEGFVQKTFIGEKPNATVVMSDSSMKNFVNMDVRKRASVYSTSAAAIRGLGSENVRERENMKFSNYDFESLKWIEENFNFSTEDVEGFYEK